MRFALKFPIDLNSRIVAYVNSGDNSGKLHDLTLSIATDQCLHLPIISIFYGINSQSKSKQTLPVPSKLFTF